MTTFSEWREQVRERVNLLDMALHEAGGRSRRSGRITYVACPFHKEETPSCAIYDDGTWWCYGACGEGGDVFSWVQKRDNISHAEAVELLARQAGVPKPAFKEEPPGVREERERAQGLIELAANWYHDMLLNHPGAEKHRGYLEGRKFGRDTWEQWRLGAAGDQDGLLALLNSVGADVELAVKIGLISDKDGRRWDFFKNRVVIPVYENGRLAFMTSRAIDANQQPKYLHLKNSDFFQKTLYGSGRGHKMVIVEGPADVWAVAELAGDDVTVRGLMGMQDKRIEKAVRGADYVFSGLDSDGTVPDKVIDAVAAAGGMEEVHVLRWPGGDDAAAWWASGQATPEAFGQLLEEAPRWLGLQIEGITKAESAPARLRAIEKAIRIVPRLPKLGGDQFVSQIKQAAKGEVQASTINELVKAERLKFSSNGHGKPGEPTNGAKPAAEQGGEQGYYQIKDGEMWRGGDEPRRILRNAIATYTKIVTVDDGEQQETVLEMTVQLRDGRKFAARVPAKESADTGKVSGYLKQKVGPRATIEAKQGPYLIAAIETCSGEMEESMEIVHTGWFERDGKLAYVTPGGVVGELPEGVTVVVPEGMEGIARYAVKDEGDEAFQQGLYGITEGLLKAFGKEIVYPLLAFTVLPVLERFLPPGKFALHLSGETGSLKTTTSKLAMAFYGDFANKPALQSWRSTVNAIELMGWYLPNVPMVVDDYKPSITESWKFTDLIHRYAEGNDRSRARRNADGVMRRNAIRCELFSTGEDIPTGESSVLARMVLLRFPRRGQGDPYNAPLRLATRHAKFFPTVTARWVGWLIEHHAELGLEAKLELNHQQLITWVQEALPTSPPNISRIAENVARLWVAWDTWWEFIAQQPGVQVSASERRAEFRELAPLLALSVSESVASEKPTQVFIRTLQEGIDSGRWTLLPVGEEERVLQNLVGYYDKEGVYILPDAFFEVSKRMREAGLQIGFSRGELYRLLRGEDLLARIGESTTVVIQVGAQGKIKSKRALHFKPGVIETGVSSSAKKGLIAPEEPPDEMVF